ncbi:MAG: hypothetical protein M1305_02570, partial [Candidatus Marsarchaeota archaeon]|nr:hypothetical protein [Candidatus Marsarchaeota archaeon]
MSGIVSLPSPLIKRVKRVSTSSLISGFTEKGISRAGAGCRLPQLALNSEPAILASPSFLVRLSAIQLFASCSILSLCARRRTAEISRYLSAAVSPLVKDI